MADRIQLGAQEYDVALWGETEERRGIGTQHVEIRVPEDQVEGFRDIDRDNRWFDVREDGGTPYRARFGRVVWKRTSPDQRRFGFFLVTGEEEGFEDAGAGLPTSEHVRAAALRSRAGLDALISELAAAGALPPEAVERIRGRLETAADDDWLDFAEVKDLEPYR